MRGHTRGNSRFRSDNHGHNWSEFDSCFEQLFSMNDVSEENRREIFLALCGDVYDRLGNNGWFRRGEQLDLHHGHHFSRRGHHGHHRHHGHRHGPCHAPGHGHGHRPTGQEAECGHICGQHENGHGRDARDEHGKPGKRGFCELHGRFRSLSCDRH